MARILVSFFNFARDDKDFNIMPPFYESFVNGLTSAGNDVLCFFHKTFTRKFAESIPEEYKNRITDFNPDLCIFFNNSFWNIADIVECPIVIYDVDSVNTFCHKDYIIRNNDRFKFVTIQNSGVEQIENILNISKHNICYIPPFTEIRSSSDILPSKNIIFVGTNFAWKGVPSAVKLLHNNPTNEERLVAAEVLKEFEKYPYVTLEYLYTKKDEYYQNQISCNDINRLAFEVSGLKRLQALSAIADLGLEIRGKYFDVDEVMKYFPEVALSYNNTVGYSLKYNQDLYNNFYIGFNTNHIQAMSGFSLFVCDIMASNACLVSEFKEDLKILFPKVNIPTFTTSYEAREQCKRILSSEYLRADIVGAAHEAIESSFRFKHVLERLEDFLSCSLHGESGHEGTLTIFSDEQNTHQKKAKQEERKNAYKSNHIKCKKIKFLGIPLQFYKRTINNNLDFYYLSFLPLFSVRRKPNKTYYNIVYFEKIKNHFLKYWYKNNTLNIISSYIRRPFNLFFAKKKLRDKGKINVCIFSDRISCWAFDYLYKLFESNSMFNTVIVVAPFMSQGKEAMISFVEQTYERLKSKGYNVIKGYDKYTDTFIDLKKQVNPDILIYNMYWKPHFHENFYIKKFKNKLNFLCEYAFSTVAHKEAKNFEINNTVVGYFEPTKLHLEEDRLWMDNKGANVIVTGSPKLDPFFDEDYRPADVWKAQDTRKKRIIWAPHHSDNFHKNLYQFNAFFELHSFMLEIADTYSDRVQFAFKPHPMLKAKLDVRWGKVIADRYYEQWRSRENTQLEQGEFIDLFLGSDAMIFDGSSFLAEYTATKKPSLFTVGGSSRLMLNNFGKLNFEVIYKTESDVKEEIVKFIEEVVIGEKDIYKEKREKFVDMYIRPSGNKLASENIYNAIVDYLTK